MAHPNEDLLRQAYAAFAAQDVAALVALWHPDLTWKQGNHNTLSGTYKGPDEILAMLGTVADQTDGTFAIDIDRVVADDNGGVVVSTITATRDDQHLSYRAVHVCTVADGKITSFEEFGDDGRAADAMFA